MLFETERLIITEFTTDMARVVHENSLDEDNRRFVPDEVFETEEEALLAALDELDTDIVLETNSIKQHNENIVELTAKKEGLMKAYQARHQL